MVYFAPTLHHPESGYLRDLRGEQLYVFADDTQWSGRVADADDAVVRGQCDERAVAAIVDAAGIAIAFALLQHVFERGQLNARDFWHPVVPRRLLVL